MRGKSLKAAEEKENSCWIQVCWRTISFEDFKSNFVRPVNYLGLVVKDGCRRILTTNEDLGYDTKLLKVA